MLLHDLLASIHTTVDPKLAPNLDIAAIHEDSRLVTPRSLFVARSGTKTDGSKFIADAKAKGAVVVLTDKTLENCPLPQVVVVNPALALSQIAHTLAGHPSKAMRVIGVTGTNGKTTTAYLIRHLLNKASKRCGMIGTVEIDDGWRRYESQMTTPAAADVAQLMATMRGAQCDACAMEVSSHSLDQSRVAGVKFAAGGFTNLTGDHMDYHKTMDHYAASKARLFEALDESGIAIVNAADPASNRMTAKTAARVMKFGFTDDADYRATDVKITAQGSHFILITPDGRTEIDMGLIGKHNIENALLAAALSAELFGLSVHQIASGLKDAAGAPGRLQSVRAGQPFACLVDYAHTHDALENVLTALRPLTKGKLRVLFGCGGDRDRTKRPKMAAVAERLADKIYITSDNPRTEDPQSILDEIKTGLRDSSRAKIEIDRRTAIEQIIADASPNDVVILAGKGHENYQILGATKHHFDDVEEATRAIHSTVVSK